MKTPLITAAAFVILSCHGLQGATIILNSVAQVGIRDDIPTTNQNGTGQVVVGNTNQSTGRTLRGLVRFDTSSIIAPIGFNIDVTSVVLNTLNDNAVGGSGALTINVREYGFEFGETTSTWNNPAGNGSDTTAGGTLGTILSTTSDIDIAANATNTFASSAAFISVVESAINGDNTVNLLLAKSNFNDANIFTRFDESAAGFQLSVTYDVVPIPEPSAALLGGLGLLALFRRRR